MFFKNVTNKIIHIHRIKCEKVLTLTFEISFWNITLQNDCFINVKMYFQTLLYDFVGEISIFI